MKYSQILFTAEQEARLCEADDPAPPAPDEILGETLYTLLSPGTELNMYLGHYNRKGIAFGVFPCKPGYAAVFRADAIGSDVKDVMPGDLLFCIGNHKSRQRVVRISAIPVPAGLEPELAPFCRLMAVSMSSLSDTAAHPPARVLVTGLGVVGLLAALIFRRCGYQVTAVEPLENRRDWATRAGLDRVLEEMTPDGLPDDKKFALHLECSNTDRAVLEGCKHIKKGGELILIGTRMAAQSNGGEGLGMQELLYLVYRNGINIRGGSEWRIPLHDTEYSHSSYYQNLEAALRWLRDGSIDPRGLYSIVSPKDPQDVYQRALRKDARTLCTMFDWSGIN